MYSDGTPNYWILFSSWSPSKVSMIQQIEALQWSYLRKSKCEVPLKYWEMLKYSKLYSLQRRRERYRIIYIWKVIKKKVPNINNSIECYYHIRHGRKCKTVHVTKSIFGTLKESSLLVNGSKLFNILPKHARDLTDVSIDKFKTTLDQFLQKVPGYR